MTGKRIVYLVLEMALTAFDDERWKEACCAVERLLRHVLRRIKICTGTWFSQWRTQ